MKKRFAMASLSIILSLLLACTGITGCSAKKTDNVSGRSNGSAIIVLDAINKDGLPNNFRIANESYIKKDREKHGKAADVHGLASLNISGSAEFSQRELAAIKKAIGKTNIVIVDLRQESHGFVNGNAVSLMNQKNNVNKGQTDAMSEKSQNRFLDSIKIGSRLSFPKPQPALTVVSVEDEAQVVNAAGMTYLRQPVTDMERPNDRTVDAFLKTLKSLPKNSWLHFHCKAGQGRATTFMSMIDMMHNSKNVSFENIIYRQYLLGGLDLTDKTTGEDVEGRYSFLKGFYKYCKSDNDHFKTTWSEWEKSHKYG